MTTTNNAKRGLDLSPWRPLAPMLTSSDASGHGFAWDMRNDATRLPLIFRLRGTSTFDVYNTYFNGWLALATPALSAVGSGAALVLHPSQGPRGTISAATSTSSFTLSSLATAGGAAVGTNQLADRGDGSGHWVRVVDNAAAASGKTETVQITRNTSGATPVITVSPVLTFTPTVNSAYEILSGRVYLLGSGAIGASTWKYYDIACNSYTAKTQTNLAATIGTDSSLMATSELYVSSDRTPGAGFLGTGATYNNGLTACCVGTASGGTSITSGALTLPATPSLATNEYRNFQVRIVEDTAIPTAVGQRRNITSHTSGNTPVYTVPAWSVTPSATAKFVVEQNDNRILCRTSASTNMYSYSISGDAWDASTTWVAGGTAPAAGVMMQQCFGLVRDPTNARSQGHVFVFAGGVSNIVDMLDITGGATGAWTTGLTYGNQNMTFTTGTSGAYDPTAANGNGGKYFYLNQSGLQFFFRFNMQAQTMEPWTPLAAAQVSPATGQKLALGYMVDGSTIIPQLYTCAQGDTTSRGFYSNTILF